MSVEEFIKSKSIIDIIVNGGCSFNFLNCRGFKNIINPISAIFIYTINSENMKEEIFLAAAIIKKEIMACLDKKMFSLKLDGVTRL